VHCEFPLCNDAFYQLGVFPRRRRSSLQKRKKTMSIRSTLIVATAIATLGLGSPAFAASYGGLSNDSGSMMSSYYDKNGWHLGLRPGREPHSPHHSSSRRGLAAACCYTPAEVVGPRMPSLARTARRPRVQASCLVKCCKTTGSGAIALLNLIRYSARHRAPADNAVPGARSGSRQCRRCRRPTSASRSTQKPSAYWPGPRRM